MRDVPKARTLDRVLTALHEMQVQLGRELASLQSDAIQRELRDMAQAIEQTRAEISALRPADADTNRIMMATEELDAIVTATERATSDITGRRRTHPRRDREAACAGG